MIFYFLCIAFGALLDAAAVSSTVIPQMLRTHLPKLVLFSRSFIRDGLLMSTGCMQSCSQPIKAHQDAARLRRRQRGVAPDQAHGAPERTPLIRQRGRLLAQLLPCALHRSRSAADTPTLQGMHHDI